MATSSERWETAFPGPERLVSPGSVTQAESRGQEWFPGLHSHQYP